MDNHLIVSLDCIFHPKAVAIAGVSERMDSFGSLFLRSLKDIGFEGTIYPVNPRYERLSDLPCFPNIRSLPGEVDLVILSTPPETVPSLVRECVQKGAKGCIINTAGFSESGTEAGRKLEEELVRSYRGTDLRIIGPNCMGIFSSRGKLAQFGGMAPVPGKASMVSQSGSLSIMAYMLGMERNILFSKIVSSGNELDLNCSDFLEYFAQDPDTEIILAYLEEVRDPRRFLQVVRSLYRKKPVIVWKAGLTVTGRRAAKSHTGALGGDAAIWKGVVSQAPLVEVQDISELMDVASLFAHLPIPRGKRLAIVSSPGGLAVNAADLAEHYGLEIPPLSETTIARLSKILPPQGTSFLNPVDMGFGAVRPGSYVEVLRVLDDDPAVDIHLVLGSSPAYRKGDFGLLSNFTREMKEARPLLKKPLVAVLLPSVIATAAHAGPLQWAGIPTYQTPTAACLALKKYIEYYLRK